MKSFKIQLEELLPRMGAEKLPDRQGPQQQLQKLCTQLGAPGRDAEQAEAAAVIAEVLGRKLPKPTRIWLLKQLQYLGGHEHVGAVAKSLGDKDPHVRDAARRALTNIPAPQANARLLARLSGSSGTFRVGLINSLGFRGDPASVAALAGLLGDRDQDTVAAAANALGKIGGSDATGALKGTYSKVPASLKLPVGDAYLRCADKLLAAGKVKEATAIYSELAAANSPRVIRMAALKGKLQAAGKAGQ